MRRVILLGLVCATGQRTMGVLGKLSSMLSPGAAVTAVVGDNVASTLNAVDRWLDATFVRLRYGLGKNNIRELAQNFSDQTGDEKKSTGEKLKSYLDAAMLVTQDTITSIEYLQSLTHDETINSLLRQLQSLVINHKHTLAQALQQIQNALLQRPEDLPGSSPVAGGDEDSAEFASVGEPDAAIDIPDAKSLKEELASPIRAIDEWCANQNNDQYKQFCTEWTTRRAIASFREYGELRKDLDTLINDQLIAKLNDLLDKYITSDDSAIRTLLKDYITGHGPACDTAAPVPEGSTSLTTEQRAMGMLQHKLKEMLTVHLGADSVSGILREHLGYPTLKAYIEAKIRWPMRIAYCIGASAVTAHALLAAHAHYRNIYQKAPAEPTTQHSLHLFKSLSVKENPILFALLLLLTLSSCVNATHSILDMLS